jgi:tetratricopeptide (TPR) repeat protein
VTGFAIAVAVGVAGVAAAAPNKPKPKPAPKKPDPPPSPEKLRAEKLFQDGRNYLAAKEYALACTAFEQSQESDPAIGTQLNIALCYEEWGKFTMAYRAYVEAERLATEKKDNRAAGAKKKVDELGPKVPRLIVEIPADADIATVFLLDGKEIDKAKLSGEQMLELGKHTIVARVPGRPAKETAIDLKEGERKKLMIDVPRPEKEVKTVVTGGKRKPGKLYGGVTMMIAGTAAIGISGYVSLVARQDYADAIKDCNGQSCEQAAFDVTQDARKKANLMTFVGAGGAVVAGVGLYLVLTSKTPRKTETVTVTPVITPGSIGLAVGGSL